MVRKAEIEAEGKLTDIKKKKEDPLSEEGSFSFGESCLVSWGFSDLCEPPCNTETYSAKVPGVGCRSYRRDQKEIRRRRRDPES